MDGPRHRSIDRRKQQGMNNLTHTDGQRLLNPSVDRPISRWIQTAPPSTCYVHFCVYTNHISSLFSPTFRDTPTLIHAAHINTHTQIYHAFDISFHPFQNGRCAPRQLVFVLRLVPAIFGDNPYRQLDETLFEPAPKGSNFDTRHRAPGDPLGYGAYPVCNLMQWDTWMILDVI